MLKATNHSNRPKLPAHGWVLPALLCIIILSCQRKAETSAVLNYDLTFNFKPYFDAILFDEVLVGDLSLPTGKIIAGDPFFTEDTKPFTPSVKPGKYPVKLLIYTVDSGHYRIAFAKIEFTKAKPVSVWRMALTEDITEIDVKELKPGNFIGYSVDAGLGCFVDQESNQVFQEELNTLQRDGKNAYDDLLANEFRQTSGKHSRSRSDGDWNNHLINKGPGQNVIMFSSGWGDGVYPSYWGFDSDGEIVELLTDFLVVTEDDPLYQSDTEEDD